MERQEAKSLGELLREAIEENRAAFRFDEINAINAWPVVIGAGIASKTMRPFVKDGLMTIRVPSASLRQELNMMRSNLARAINAEVGKDVIKEIKFR